MSQFTQEQLANGGLDVKDLVLRSNLLKFRACIQASSPANGIDAKVVLKAFKAVRRAQKAAGKSQPDNGSVLRLGLPDDFVQNLRDEGRQLFKPMERAYVEVYDFVEFLLFTRAEFTTAYEKVLACALEKASILEAIVRKSLKSPKSPKSVLTSWGSTLNADGKPIVNDISTRGSMSPAIAGELVKHYVDKQQQA